jgi:uncharacterized membrane protein (UPF0182 family)
MPEPLSRIPLSLEEEHTVDSMARWMRFMAIVGICGALAMLLVIILAVGMYSSLHGIDAPTSDPRWPKIQAAIIASGSLPYFLGLAFLLAAAVSLWQNMILFSAGDDFHLVARTDTADLDYLAHGLDRLRTFFKIQVLTVAIAVAVAFVTGVVVVGLMRSH